MVVQAGTELSDVEVDRLFRALVDAIRRDIVRRTLASSRRSSRLPPDPTRSDARSSSDAAPGAP
jgi:hypothetical protein